MKVKTIAINIKSADELKDDVIGLCERAEKGEYLDEVKDAEVSFASIEAVKKILTLKRIQLLKVIKRKHPKSLRELSRMLKRDIKNVAEDIKILEQVGLVSIEKEGKSFRPQVGFDEIGFRLAL